MKIKILAVIIILSLSSSARAGEDISYTVDRYTHEKYQQLKQFMLDIKTYGFNYFKAKKLVSSKSLQQLERLMEDGNFAEYKPYITNMIGMVGNKSALQALNKYVSQQKGNASPNILQSYGFLAQNNNDAFNKLVAIATYGDENREFTDESGYGGPSAAAIAVQALGISGRKDAMQVLSDLSNPANSNYRADLQQYIKYAIELNRNIQMKGFDKSFDDNMMRTGGV